ncbi:MAG TPA: hypothetical protein PKU74_10030, partial [Candidatus Omnitrophota bacterium]|nr:hypothetical protein [Candidatus Omnitrophota bacterium]
MCIVVGLGTIAWFMWKEKKVEQSVRRRASPVYNQPVTTSELLTRVGIRAEEASVKAGKGAPSQEAADVLSEYEGVATEDINRALELSILHDDLDRKLRECTEQHHHLKALITDKKRIIKNTSAALRGERRSIQEFDHIRNHLNDGIARAKEERLALQERLKEKEQEARECLDNVNLLEENIKQRESAFRDAEIGIKNCRLDVQMAQKKAAEVEEKIREKEKLVADKSEKLLNLIARIKEKGEDAIAFVRKQLGVDIRMWEEELLKPPVEALQEAELAAEAA